MSLKREPLAPVHRLQLVDEPTSSSVGFLPNVAGLGAQVRGRCSEVVTACKGVARRTKFTANGVITPRCPFGDEMNLIPIAALRFKIGEQPVSFR